MKTALALRHVPFEHLGVLESLLLGRGYAVRTLDAGLQPLPTEALAAADLVVVLGGPIGAFDDDRYPFLREETDAIARRLAARKPLLGICLGAQLMARALGAAVAPMGDNVKEIGFAPLTLTAEGAASPLAPLADGTPVLHWHGDRFELPPGATRLASTSVCAEQAFALGDHALGLQFHLEADLRELEAWLIGHAAELAAAGIDPRTLRGQAPALAAPLAQRAHDVFTAWLDRAEAHAARSAA
ncbi:glutamine amidotransferase [Ralstonia pseudosolanacearum]|uniref:Glutamine amidotransferase n=4 Tax=Ralstonia solanacearum species complex TaxID=3116862 RepID=A0A0S4UXI6_RALSL|nr:glutamine amidotransferase [Ralstonia pseudosolanacearum]AUS44799.1 glutamine amidotransferase [Ralstonia solanacearum]ASL72304.1 glutamine amidotransferase [Ralstonia pseudosolanacearum]AST86897.1 glutamine amidotransferase [Ralstonia pseudosolanacearum]AXW15315.1 glutamine amidotransferase [Ralstonia solanacearum]AXW38784.1 glutamine amidotransferase [Ralstonia solanacearum]